MNETFQIPVIHIIRNPYDVIASQQRVKFHWLYNLQHFKDQKNLVGFVKEKFDFDLLDTKSLNDIEVLALRWCLENVLPLQAWEPYQYKHRIVKHEDLRNDLHVFIDLCNEFNIEPLANIEKEYIRPSSKTHPKSNIIDITRTDKKFTSEEMIKISTILKIFECELYPIIH